MAKKPWELDYEPTVEQSLQAPAGLATQGAKPWEQSYAMPVEPGPAAPTERIRTFLQGATFGGAEEAEAQLRELAGGKPYEQGVAELRQQLQQYRTNYPAESFLLEMAGGAAPAIAAAPFTGGTSMGMTLPAMGRVAGLSALQGGLTGFGTAEGGFTERLPAAATGAAFGAIAGPTSQAVLQGGGVVANAVLDFARRRLGARGAKAVEAEIQRLMEDSGLTAEEIVKRVANGELMGEQNKTLQEAVRGYLVQGGPAAAQIRGTFGPRAEQLRRQATAQIQEGLTPGTAGNVLQKAKMDEDAIRAAERAMYGQAFAQGGVVEKPLLDAFATAMQRSPAARRSVNELFKAETGKTPFYRVLPDGNIEYMRTPTLEEMEIARRGIQQTVDEMYRAGKGATGGALKEIELQLRDAINKSSPTLQAARTQAAQVRTASEAFQEGRKALTMSADQVELAMSQMTPAQITAFRGGLMDAIRNRMTTGSRQSMMSNLANEETKEGRILRSVFPQDMLDNVLQRVGVAAQAQQARNVILGGSQTAITQGASRRIGMGMSAEEVASAARGDPFALLRVARKFVATNTQNLNDKQRLEVARILTSSDPDLVRRALVDDSAMAMLQEMAQRLGATVATGARGAAATATGSMAGRGQ